MVSNHHKSIVPYLKYFKEMVDYIGFIMYKTSRKLASTQHRFKNSEELANLFAKDMPDMLIDEGSNLCRIFTITHTGA